MSPVDNCAAAISHPAIFAMAAVDAHFFSKPLICHLAAEFQGFYADSVFRPLSL